MLCLFLFNLFYTMSITLEEYILHFLDPISHYMSLSEWPPVVSLLPPGKRVALAVQIFISPFYTSIFYAAKFVLLFFFPRPENKVWQMSCQKAHRPLCTTWQQSQVGEFDEQAVEWIVSIFPITFHWRLSQLNTVPFIEQLKAVYSCNSACI